MELLLLLLLLPVLFAVLQPPEGREGLALKVSAHLSAPCKVASVQTQGPELLVAYTHADLADSDVR